MISKHESIVKEFRILRFEIAEIDGRGQPQRYTFLNEDQSIFILTLSKNTDQVISLKRDLTKEFSRYRAIVLKEARAFRRQGRLEFQQARLEGKVERRELTDAIKRLVEWAGENNPESNVERYYVIFTKMVATVLFNLRKFEKNLRDEIPASALRKLQMVESAVATWLNEVLDKKPDYHEPYRIIKERTKKLVDLIGQYDLSVPA